MNVPEVQTMSPAIAFDIIDRLSKDMLDINGEAFINNWNAGRYEDCTAPAYLIATLIPFLNRK